MWMLHLKFTVSVLVVLLMLFPATLLLKLLLNDKEFIVLDAVTTMIKDIHSEVYFKE